MSEKVSVFADFGHTSFDQLKKKTNLSCFIELGLDGFSYTIAEDHSKIIGLKSIHFQELESFGQLIERLIPVLNEMQIHRIEFSEVSMMLSHQYATIVPEVLSITDNVNQVLELNFETPFQKLALVDELESMDSRCVYAVPDKSMKIGKEFNGPFDIKHAKSIVLESKFVKKITGEKDSAAILNIRESFFDIYLYDYGILKYHNSFEYNSRDEFLYFLLAVFNELSIKPDIFPLFIMGRITDSSPIIDFLKRFFSQIEFLKNEIMPEIFGDVSESVYDHFFYNLINFSNCE